jgi:alpha-1,2-mannosyltransferase
MQWKGVRWRVKFRDLTRGAHAAGTRDSAIGGSLAARRSLAKRSSAHARGVRSIPTVWIPIGVGLLAVGICCYQLSLPSVLLGIHSYTGIGYDDGVYLGAATRLVHGVLPYRDFDFVQPPGITLVTGPVALAGRLIGTRDAMAVARCLTAAVAGVNAALAALALRDRGRVAMLVAGISLAVFPLAVAADHTLLLEPYLVSFCLLGVIALFRGGELASPRRVLFAGLAFGFAGSIKLWAVLPAIAALICCVPAWRRQLGLLLIGLALGFVGACVVFFALAPHAFIHDVFSAQIHRGTSGRGALTLTQRLVMISGISGLPGLNATTGLAVGLFVSLAALTAVVYVTTWRRRPRIDWFILLSAAIVVLGMFVSPEFYDHYAYFPAAFLAMLLGVNLSQLVAWGRHLLFDNAGSRRRPLAAVTAIVVVLLLGAGLVLLLQQDTTYAASYLSGASDPALVVDAQIPEGACVVTDYAIFTITANRFNPVRTDCPAVVDPFGMWLSRDNGQPPPAAPPFPPEFSAAWRRWFEQADYVVLSVPFSDYIPWTSQLQAYFDSHYVLVSSQAHSYVYNHFDRLPTGATEVLIKRGTAALNSGHTGKAKLDFESAVHQDSADPDAIFDVGVVDQRLGQVAAAQDAYQRALLLDPRFTSALFNLALLDYKSEPQTAIDLYRRILRIKPGDVNTEYNLGLLLIESGQQADGEQLLKSAVGSDPGLASRLPPGVTVP